MTDPKAFDSPVTRLDTEKVAAAYLNVSCRTLQAWRLRGGGPAFVRVGRAIRYDRSDLDRYIAERTHSSTSTTA